MLNKKRELDGKSCLTLKSRGLRFDIRRLKMECNREKRMENSVRVLCKQIHRGVGVKKKRPSESIECKINQIKVCTNWFSSCVLFPWRLFPRLAVCECEIIKRRIYMTSPRVSRIQSSRGALFFSFIHPIKLVCAGSLRNNPRGYDTQTHTCTAGTKR